MTPRTIIGHAPQLSAQGNQTFYTPFDVFKTCLRGLVGKLTRLSRIVLQVQKRADRRDLEAKLTGMPYKRKPT